MNLHWPFADVRSTHVPPPSVEVYMEPSNTAAASFIPSAEEDIDTHSGFPADCLSVQVSPPLVEV